MHIVAFTLAAFLGISSSLPTDLTSNIPADSSSPIKQTGYINVSVATIWTTPNKPRPVDAPALTSPVHIQKWLNSMTTKQYLDLTDDNRDQTQALYGTKVDILRVRGEWYEVAVTGQPTPKNALGYPGFVPARQVALDPEFGELQSSKSFALVDSSATAPLYRDPELMDRMIQLSFDTRLPVLNSSTTTIQVAIPGSGSAYISKQNAAIYDAESSIPYPTSTDLVTTAKLFLGKPYLWSGTSGYAFDCSGFTHTIYSAHGILLSRDASAQATYGDTGVAVGKGELREGDLLFYAYNVSDAGSIHHVAMYTGEGEMAEAYGAGVPVRVTGVRLEEGFWGARRYLE